MYKNWRFLELTAPIREIFATEEILLRSSPENPILMLYRSNPHSVSIAEAQDINEIDIEKCAQLGVEWSRRPTGGRFVYHNWETDFSYCIIAPKAPFIRNEEGKNPDNPTGAYRYTLEMIVDVLQSLGVNAELEYINDQLGFRNTNIINVNGKKISASSQIWSYNPTHFLQHGYILHKRPNMHFAYQLIKSSKSPEERAEEALKMSATITDSNPHATFENIVKAFYKKFDASVSSLTQEEQEKIRTLLAEKYDSVKWQYTANGREEFMANKGDCIRCDHRGIGAVLE